MESQFQRLQDELRLSQYENITLKKLMAGKDSLVMQRTMALDVARQIIDHLKAKDEQIGSEVQRLLERIDFIPSYPVGNGKTEMKIEIR